MIDNDPAGLPTVGFGHLCDDPECSEVPYPIPLSEADGEQLLRDDVAVRTPIAERLFTRLIRRCGDLILMHLLQVAQDCITTQTAEGVTLNANQYAALVSWAFNIGCGASGSSTLIERLNALEDPNVVVPEELPKFNQGGGEVLPGLERRRAEEVDLFLAPTAEPVLPADC